MSQEPARNPDTNGVCGWPPAHRQHQGAGKREVTCPVHLCLPLDFPPGSMDGGLEEGKWWAGQFLHRLNQPLTPGLRCVPRKGPDSSLPPASPRVNS